MTEAEIHEIVRRYVDREITVEAAADGLVPGTAVVDLGGQVDVRPPAGPA